MPYQERERGRNLELFCFISLFCCSFKKLFAFSWRVIALQCRVGFCHKSARISHGGGGLVTQSCLTLVTPWTVARQAPLSMGIVQARTLEWVAISFSRESSDPLIESKYLASPALQTLMQETWVQFLGREYPLEKGMATHTSILAWTIPMDRGAWGLQSMGSQRIRHD